MEIRWIVSFSASCFHAVAALCRGATLTAPDLAALGEPTQRLVDDLAARRLPVERVVDRLAMHAAAVDYNRELADLALTKVIGRDRRDQDVEALARHLTSLESAYRKARPNLADDLELRARPLIEQWEARGPGLLAAVGRLIEADLLAERADVVLVEPVLGGAGAAHLPNNSVRIEALLANPQPRLPEVLRLAWLLAQLNLDLPRYSERICPSRREHVIALAMLPPALAAAEEVELVQLRPDLLDLALKFWRLTEAGDVQQAVRPVAEALTAWWETYCAARPRFAAALAALDRLLAGDEPAGPDDRPAS